MSWSTAAMVLPLVAVVLWLIDRALLAAEDRGWIYWRHRQASSSRLGSAMLSVQGLVEPDKNHIVEERQREEADIDFAADDDPLETRSSGAPSNP